MSTRDVRDLIIEAWGGELRNQGMRDPYIVARRLAAIAEGHGITLTRPAHIHDPDADWRREPAPERITAAAAASDYQAAKAAITKPTEPTRSEP